MNPMRTRWGGVLTRLRTCDWNLGETGTGWGHGRKQPHRSGPPRRSVPSPPHHPAKGAPAPESPAVTARTAAGLGQGEGEGVPGKRHQRHGRIGRQGLGGGAFAPHSGSYHRSAMARGACHFVPQPSQSMSGAEKIQSLTNPPNLPRPTFRSGASVFHRLKRFGPFSAQPLSPFGRASSPSQSVRHPPASHHLPKGIRP
jgi:hypothetical protein